MTKKFMPFWYADVIACEEKLEKLSQKGLHLVRFSPLTGMFFFETGEEKKERYRICLAPGCKGKIPKGLIQKGWEEVHSGKNMYVVKNPDENIEGVPSYKSWKTLNRIVLMIFAFIICFAGGFFCGGFLSSLDMGEPFDMDIIELRIIAALGIISAVLFIITFRANRRLSKTGSDLGLKRGLIKTIPEENFTYTKKEEKQMLKDGRMMKKSPIGWFYSPDKAEQMVEKLAREGWKFYRFNEMGTEFYFIKTDPCNLKFVVDFQNEAGDDYFSAAKDDGWKLEFTSMTRTMSFIIWSKEYENEEDIPMFYTDFDSAMTRARRMALTIGLPMLGIIVLCFINFGIVIGAGGFEAAAAYGVYSIVFALITVEYVVFGIRAISYYFRIKKKKQQGELE